MYNDIAKVVVEGMARGLGQDEAYVVNNFHMSIRFKVVKQNVEVIVHSTDKGLSLEMKHTGVYDNWETTPVVIVPPAMATNYDPDRETMLVVSNVTTEQIDEIITGNNCIYIGSTFTGRQDSDEYLDAALIRNVVMSISIRSGC